MLRSWVCMWSAHSRECGVRALPGARERVEECVTHGICERDNSVHARTVELQVWCVCSFSVSICPTFAMFCVASARDRGPVRRVSTLARCVLCVSVQTEL